MGACYRTIPQHAKDIGVGVTTLREAAKRGEVPGAFQIGARWLVNVDAFEASHGLLPSSPAPPGQEDLIEAARALKTVAEALERYVRSQPHGLDPGGIG